MSFRDDPRLTRYALGEMNDDERTAFERELSDADRAEVEAIRAVGAELGAAFRRTDIPVGPTSAGAADSASREGTAARAADGQAGMPVLRGKRPRHRHPWLYAAAAAVVIAGVGLAAGVLSTRGDAGRPGAYASSPVSVRPTSRPGAAAEFAVISDIGIGTPASTPASGPNVIYGDGHVEFQQSPFVGAQQGGQLAARGENAPAGLQVNGIKQQLDTGGEYSLQAQGVSVTDEKITASGSTDAVAAANKTSITAAARRPMRPAEARSASIAAAAPTPHLMQAGTELSSAQPAPNASLARGADATKEKQRESLEFRYARVAGDADGDGIADPGLRPVRVRGEGRNTESYAPIAENRFVDVRSAPLSTFGVDVDTASYANVRRFLTSGQKPPADAVRVEELINYFPTADVPPTDGRPFATHVDLARCPWAPSHDLVRIALKAKEVDFAHRPPSNLVFLIDVSGSMDEPNKLPLVKRGLSRLVDQLGENDRVAIVVYAGSSGLVLPSTNASNKEQIRQSIERLSAGGSTNGGQGIELAYKIAGENFRKEGANRVILCTDGDFNVGVTDRGSLVELIQEKAKAGVFLSVFGFGTGNVKDDTMESLADKGNGNYAYVDNDREAHKCFVEQASGTLLTVAKDVKVQIEFNPAAVKSYRLIGYENRALAAEDFKNDLKDAGEIGAGHNVVALYEIERTGAVRSGDPVSGEPLKYQPAAAPAPAPTTGPSDELLTVKLRYKAPDAPLEQGVSQLIEQPLKATDAPAIDKASADFQFDAAVAGFGMLLRGSANRGACDWAMVQRLAEAGLGPDSGGHRAEFLALVQMAEKAR